MTEASSLVRFELEMLGGGVERRYRKLRPDIEALPWGSYANLEVPPEVRLDAQARWTRLAFNEYGSSAWVMLMMRTMLEARIPLDLAAYGCRFAIDELAHAELGALMAMELGGATEILYDPDEFLPNDAIIDRTASPLLRAAKLAIRVSCVDEVLSLSLLRGLSRATTDPLARGVFSAILRDEAPHAAFGAIYLDWAMPQLDAADLAELTEAAQSEVDRRRAREARPTTLPAHWANPLAWMDSEAAREGQAKALRERVIAPLQTRGIHVR